MNPEIANLAVHLALGQQHSRWVNKQEQNYTKIAYSSVLKEKQVSSNWRLHKLEPVTCRLLAVSLHNWPNEVMAVDEKYKQYIILKPKPSSSGIKTNSFLFNKSEKKTPLKSQTTINLSEQ